jgi:hypothetical protein
MPGGGDLVKDGADFKWILKQLPKYKEQTSKVQLIYKAVRDGWSAAEFHKLCDNQGPTLTVIRSAGGRVCGGYASVSWESKTSSHWTKDSDSFVFSVDYMTIYRPSNENKALYQGKDWGPGFGGDSLRLGSSVLNKKESGFCYTVGQGGGNNINEVPQDKEGNSIITGEGKNLKGREKRFTCVALEIYKLIY